MQKKILYVVSDGGFFLSHRMAIALAAKKAGYCVAVAAPHDQAVPIYKKAGFKFFEVPFSRRKHKPLNEYKTVSSLSKAIRQFCPDLAHLITAKPVIYGGIVCRYHRVSSISAIPGLGHLFSHDSPLMLVARKAVLCAYKFAINNARNHVIFQNKDDIEIFKAHGILRKASHTLIAGCGVDLKRIHPKPLPSRDTTVLLPARMTRNKGVEEFVAVARLFHKRGIAATFRLVGDPDDGNPTAVSEHQLKAWSKEENIEWKRYTANIEEELADCHIVVLPSYREGFPKTLMDAAAAGRACAASDIPGNRDAVMDGDTGVLFPVKNVEAMAQILEGLVLDRSLQEEMGKRARQHAVEYFDVAKICKDHLDAYEDVLSMRHGG